MYIYIYRESKHKQLYKFLLQSRSSPIFTIITLDYKLLKETTKRFLKILKHTGKRLPMLNNN